MKTMYAKISQKIREYIPWFRGAECWIFESRVTRPQGYADLQMRGRFCDEKLYVPHFWVCELGRERKKKISIGQTLRKVLLQRISERVPSHFLVSCSSFHNGNRICRFQKSPYFFAINTLCTVLTYSGATWKQTDPS